MKKANKVLSVILVVMMVISIIPITASATTRSGTAGNNITWELDVSTGVLTFSGTGEMYFYSSSNTPWGTYKNRIKEVVINEGITTIGEYAFYNFYITSVTIPNSLIRIEDFAFKNCTKLTTLTIPEGVKQIDSNAFSNCTNLTSVTMYKGVGFIGDNAFAKCTALTDVYYSGSQKDWNLINIHSGNGNLVNANITYAEGGSFTWEFDKETGTLTFNGNGEIPDYYNEDEDYFIKQPWDDIEKDIKHIVFNEGITSIGAYAFAYCDSLETVTMSSVVTIGDHAFYDCPVLKKLTTSNSLKVIGDHAFRDCKKFTYIYYSGTQEEWNNVSIGEHWNGEMDKVKVYPSDYVVYSDSGTFRALTGGNTFSWEFDADTLTLTVSGEGDIGLIISLPWKNYQFDIKKLVLSDCITSVYSVIFSTLPNLTEIVIPASISKISKESFNNSNHCITDVYYTGTEEQWKSITIGENNDALLKAVIHYNYGKSFTGIKDNHFYINDEMQKAYQLVEFDGDFYFINDYHKIAKSKRIYLSQKFVDGFTYEDGTPLKVGYYDFDENGKMIIHNGVVGDYFYKNNERLKAYQLVEFEGDFYFINDSHKLAKNKTLYLSERFVTGFTYEDGTPLQSGYYTFDENGKMVILNGPVGDYFYKDGAMLKAYQLVEFEGNYYFINDSNKLAKNKTIYLTQRFVEGTDLAVGYYEFDADGKMIIK